MDVVNLLKDYWTLIVFFSGIAVGLIAFIRAMIESVKCSLRNDILDIFDRCKEKKQITHYQLESIQYSANLYFKLKGNSFIKDIVERVKNFELID